MGLLIQDDFKNNRLAKKLDSKSLTHNIVLEIGGMTCFDWMK